MKNHGASAIPCEDTVQHEGMDMHVQIEGPAEPLDDGHGPAAAIRHAVATRAAAQPAQHGPHVHRDDRAAQIVVPRQLIPQAMGHAQDPLSDRHVGEHMIDEVRRPLGHAPAATPWAEPATLARDRHEAIHSAGGAPKSGEASSQTSAPQEVAELLLDKSREPFAVPQRRGVRTEGLDMVPHDPVQDRRRGIARLVCARWLRHAQSTGAPRANTREQ